MAKRKHKHENAAPAHPASADASVAHGAPPPPGAPPTWFHAHRRDIRFITLFGLWLAVFYVLATRSYFETRLFPKYCALNAGVSGALLNGAGIGVNVHERTVRSATHGFAIEVARGCDAIEPSALFCAAVLASPVVWWRRVVAALMGTVLLMVLNLARVISLFLVGVYWRSAFDTMHLEVWQVAFIFLAILLWGLWAARMARRVVSNAVAPG